MSSTFGIGKIKNFAGQEFDLEVLQSGHEYFLYETKEADSKVNVLEWDDNPEIFELVEGKPEYWGIITNCFWEVAEYQRFKPIMFKLAEQVDQLIDLGVIEGTVGDSKLKLLSNWLISQIEDYEQLT